MSTFLLRSISFGRKLAWQPPKTTFDLDQEEGYSFDQFGRAIVPSWDEFLVTSGVISIHGTLSNTTLAVPLGFEAVAPSIYVNSIKLFRIIVGNPKESANLTINCPSSELMYSVPDTIFITGFPG